MQTSIQTAELQPAPAPTAPLLVTAKDAAKMLGVSTATTWRLIAADHLKTRKIGARTLITMESIRRVAENGAA